VVDLLFQLLLVVEVFLQLYVQFLDAVLLAPDDVFQLLDHELSAF
jgi:hypothetical protein